MSNSFLTSILIHSGLLALVVMLSPLEIVPKAEELITIEVLETEAKPFKVSKVESKDSSPTPITAKKIEVIKDQIEVKKGLVKSSPVAKIKTSEVKQSVVNSSSKGNTLQPTLDDIDSSELDYESVLSDKQGRLNGDELDEEFSRIDKKNKNEVDQTKKNFESDLKNFESDVENQLAETEASQQKEAAALASKAMALKQSGASSGMLNSSVNKGPLSVGTAAGKVRSIENLRQLGSNPKPSYSMEERFQKQQGTVVFQAYVTEQGSLKDFKLVQSTGYKNLDGKTLAVLKKWKFYPGQQGWVEIPQTWSLKGDSEQMPTMLRRKISQR